MNLDYVKKRDGKKVEFKSEKIENAVNKAAAAVNQDDSQIAEKITAEVLSYLKIFFKNGGIVEVEQIQDLVEKVLIEKGYAEIAKAYILYREQHSKLRDSKKLFADAVNIMDDYLDCSDWKVNENSNMSYSLQGLNNFIASEVTGQYWLQEIYPKETAKLHSSGDLHIHDLGNLSVYCCGWDLEELLRTGFRGVSTKIESAPPKHLKTALGQIVNFFYTLQGEASGAMAFSNFDTYLAPFIDYDGLNSQEVKQAMQEFLFNMNVPTRVGFQSPFTNITMDLEVPNYLKDQAVIIGGQYQEKCYGEFQQEMDMLNRAFAELMMEGDAKGRMFSFPIPTYNITEDFEWGNEKLNPVWEMTAKFGIPYFCLSENTFIITDKGSKKLKNININKDKVLGDDGNFYSITNLFKNNHKEYIKIITEKQQKIECSKNHKFPTDNGLKKAEDLSLNDKLQEYSKQIVFENGFILSYENHHLFDIFDKSGKKTRFEKINKNEIDDFYCLRIRNRKRKKIDKFNYEPNRFQTTLKDIGLKFGRGDEKEIPQIIYKRNDEEIGALLRGLFDTDGIYLFVNKINETNNYVEIKSLTNIKKEISTVDIHVNSENHLFTLKNNVVVHNSNFINSDMDPEDARSMAILGAQEVIYKNQNGNIAKNEIRHLVNNWIEAPKNKKPDYKMLMDGKFVDIIDMFEVPYKNYSTYINIELENGYKQSFSYEHKCAVVRNGEFKEVESQDLLVGDEFLLSKKAYSQSFIGNYKSGKILGYYLGEGWINNHSKGEICFAININRKDIVNEIKNYFNEIACKVKIEKIDADSIYKINVYGKQAVGFVKDYIRGKKATTKRLNNFVWNTSVKFRTGIVDGLYETDGHKNNNILFHTTNKKLAEDLITLANTIGKRLKYRENNKNTRYFKQDRSDKEIFTSYELKFKDDYNTFKLDNSNFDLVKIKNVRQIGTKTDTVYNFTVDTSRHLYELPNGIITHQCCRLRLDNKELRKRGGGLFGANPLTGSLGVITLNMPRIGYQVETKEEFMERVYYLMDQAKESLEVKRKVLETLTEQGLYPYAKFYLRDIKKRFDQYWKNHFNTIGLNGMNEALLNFMGKDISTPAGQQFSDEIMKKMRERLQQYQEENDNLYNLEATPAESTAYRFARLDREKFGNQIIAANQERVVKEGADPYYTNSTQLPVGLTDDIFTALELQDELQSLYTGGTVFHGFLGEKIDSIAATKKMVKRIAENFKLPYYTLTPSFSICPVHGYLPGEHEYCPKCEAEAEAEDESNKEKHNAESDVN